jgi:hypothetical protein
MVNSRKVAVGRLGLARYGHSVSELLLDELNVEAVDCNKVEQFTNAVVTQHFRNLALRRCG